MPSHTDLTPAELSTISDGDDIRLQRAAFEIGRRRYHAALIEDESRFIEAFVAKPVNRASFPLAIAAIERVLAAHRGGQGAK